MSHQVKLMASRLQVPGHGITHDAHSDKSDFAHIDLCSLVSVSLDKWWITSVVAGTSAAISGCIVLTMPYPLNCPQRYYQVSPNFPLWGTRLRQRVVVVTEVF